MRSKMTTHGHGNQACYDDQIELFCLESAQEQYIFTLYGIILSMSKTTLNHSFALFTAGWVTRRQQPFEPNTCFDFRWR